MEGALRKRLGLIKKQFERIEEIEADCTSEEIESMERFHHEGSTLPYCIRWGLQGISELIDNLCVCKKCEKEWIELDDLDRDLCDDCSEEEKEEEKEMEE